MKSHYRLLAAVLTGLLATSAWAQAPSGGAMPAKIYTKRTMFRLPFRVDDKERASLREIKLFVKNGPNEPWVCKETASAAQNDFTYHVTDDGEYWFCVVTVDNNGHSTPADINREPPGLIVVVDTKAPDFDLKPITLTTGETALACRIKDANPDFAKTRLEYRTDHNWVALEPMGDQPGIYRMPDASMRGLVRATIFDKAGNSTAREVNLMGSRVTQAPSNGENVNSYSGTAIKDPNGGAPLGMNFNGPGVVPTDYRAEKAPAPSTAYLANTHPNAAPSLQLINSTHASLDYQVDNLGPSGIGKVEVWITRDEGQTWTKLCEDQDRKSPADIDLPGEGLYGISLVVSNGSGTGGVTPTRGDNPDWWVEVDTTKPQAQLLPVRPSQGDDGNVFLLTWTASDKNLKSDPIDLFYSTQQGGTWVPIARGLKNTGNYRWSVPRGVGPEYYFRMDVSDRAGNIAHCELTQPVVLDTSRPKARVVGVAAGGAGRGAPGYGN